MFLVTFDTNLFTNQIRISATKVKFGDLKFSMDISRGYPRARIISVKSFDAEEELYMRSLQDKTQLCDVAPVQHSIARDSLISLNQYERISSAQCVNVLHIKHLVLPPWFYHQTGFNEGLTAISGIFVFLVS